MNEMLMPLLAAYGRRSGTQSESRPNSRIAVWPRSMPTATTAALAGLNETVAETKLTIMTASWRLNSSHDEPNN